MTVSSEQSDVSYDGDNATLTFPIPFYFLLDTDLRVSVVNQDGTELLLVLGTDYTVTGAGNQEGGALTLLGSPIPAQQVLLIDRDPPVTQETAYQANDPFPAKEHEKALDKLTMLLQRLSRTYFNALHFPLTEHIDGTLPQKSERLGMIQAYDPVNGLPIVIPMPASIGAGDMRFDAFIASTEPNPSGLPTFTPGTTTQLTLSRPPGAPANLELFFDGFFQGIGWSLSGSVVTFDAPIPVGTTYIFARIGTSLSLLVPPDQSVSDGTIVQGSILYNRMTYLLDARDKGAIGNGTTDDRAALLAADQTGKPWFLSAGVYRVGSNLTINGHLTLMPGAVIKPDAGVTVTFAQNFTATPGGPQIFDLSNAAANISLPYNVTEVWAEWWGAKGDAVKTNNQVPIQQALNAVAATATGGTGVSYGTVRLGRGWFLVSGVINIPNYTSLVGSSKAYTVIKANAATWVGTQMFVATNGGAGMFDSNIKHMRISASNIAAITYVVYTTAWQESCGMSNCLVLDFMTYGFFYEVGDAGAATMRLEDCEFSPADSSVGSTAIYLTNSFTQAWQNFHLVRTTVGTGAAPPNNITGIRVKGRCVIVTEALHFEGVTNGFILETDATVVGVGVNGGAQQTNIFNCLSGWTGSIRSNGCRLGAAANMITDTARPYAIAAAEPLDGNVVWPLDGSQPIAVGYITGGASPSFYYQSGRYAVAPFSSLTRPSTGAYNLVMAASLDNVTSYHAVVISQDPATPIANANPQNASTLQVNTRNSSGALADTQGVLVQVYHKP